jgi:crotonobetaine/carnitine-CoA ligase
MRVWFAINWIGAIYVPVNTAYRGNILAHVIENANSRVIVANGDLIERLAEIDRSNLEMVVAIGGTAPKQSPLRLLHADILDRDDLKVPELDRPIEPWDIQSVIYTSGTTGRSKGVVSSYAHLHEMSGVGFPMVDSSDCVLVYSPFFHVGGTMQTTSALIHGGCVGLAGEFSTEGFWPAVDATRATFVAFLGVMSTFIASARLRPTIASIR